jgi:hypothetical protein
MSSDQRSIQTSELKINIGFESKLPFPKDVLSDAIKDKGFEVGSSNNNLISQKNNRRLAYSPDQGLINLTINELSDIEDSFEEVKDLIQSDMGISVNEIESVEVSSELIVYNGETTTQIFQEYYESPELPDSFGGQPTPAGIRLLSSPDFDVDNSDVYDVKIEPYVNNLDYYYVEYVHRKPSLDAIGPYITNFEKNVNQILDEVEEPVNGAGNDD